ncbi:hypothetical protein OAG76_02070 [Rubripirellula sp.]|nr:hypothetical protein [Rubripirellula sp.]MDB4634170.1 hypothetical protein [Rubripirellula sp.]
MDTFVSIVGWGLCLGIGGPLALIGFFHFASPKAVWSVYRGWPDDGKQIRRKSHPAITPVPRCVSLESPVGWEV